MQESEFQNKVVVELKSINKTMVELKVDLDKVKEKIDDVILSEDDKLAIDEALKDEKEGKLLSREEVFENA